MNLYFIKDPASLEFLPLHERKNLLFLCFNWGTQAQLAQLGLTAEMYDSSILPKDGTTADEFIFRLSQEWYKNDGTDFTIFQDVSLGKIYWWVLWWRLFIPTYKFLLAVYLLVTREKPEKIWCDAGLEPFQKKIIEQIKEQGKFDFRLQYIHSKRGEAKGVLPGSLAGWKFAEMRFKKRFFYSLYNAISGLMGMFAHKDREETKNILISYCDLSLNSLFTEWLKDSHGMQFFLASHLSFDLSRKYLMRGVKILHPPFLQRMSLSERKQIALIQKKWGEIKSNPVYKNKFSYLGISPWEVVEEGLNRFFKQIPNRARDVIGYKKSMLKNGIRCVVVPFDVPPIERTLVEVAKSCNIPTLTILHGLYFNYNTLENCLTDYLVVWGNALRDIYKNMGRQKNRIFVAGNPQFDKYVKGEVHTLKRGSLLNVLLLTNPHILRSTLGSDGDPEFYILTLLNLLLSYETLKITVKLHPSESLGYYTNLLRDMKKQVSVVRDAPIEDLLKKADLVICPFTTVLIEAMILNKPVISVNFSKLPYAPPVDGSMGFEAYSDLTSLKKKIDDILTFGVDKCKIDYTNILDRFAGPLDGKSSERILSIIANLTNRSMK